MSNTMSLLLLSLMNFGCFFWALHNHSRRRSAEFKCQELRLEIHRLKEELTQKYEVINEISVALGYRKGKQ